MSGQTPAQAALAAEILGIFEYEHTGWYHAKVRANQYARWRDRSTQAAAAQQPEPAPEPKRPWLHVGCGGRVYFDHGGGYCAGCEAEGLDEGDYAQQPPLELGLDGTEPPMLTLYRAALERLADEDTPVLATGLGGGAQEELHVRASFAAHTLGRDTCGCNDCLASLDPDGDQ